MSNSILVVGGGFSGLTAAIEAAELGYDVYIVEKTPFLGGRVAQLNKYFPKLCPPSCGLEIQFQRIRKRLFSDAALREPFLSGSRPLMAYANLLTFNARALTLYVSLLLGLPWLYFVAEISVFTILYTIMRFRHESLCKRLAAFS